MKTFLFSLIGCLLVTIAYSQEITNLVLVGDKGITEDIKEAREFIVVKRLPDGLYQRCDYKLRGPQLAFRTYTNSTLTMLNGQTGSYRPDGSIMLVANYKDNKKDGKWFYVSSTGKSYLSETYKADSLINSEVLDTTKKDKEKTEPKAGEREAQLKGGGKAWMKYLVANIKADLAQSSMHGGEIRVAFIVSEDGKPEGIFLHRSVEFVLDEEALRVIYKMPAWMPALKEDKPVKAYRIQPITFVKAAY
ncbi:MAG: TonB family protein [Ferruginibacter sp.]|nr:TonB family protein [Ferruginibacter sp.]